MNKELRTIGKLRLKQEYWLDRNGKPHYYKPKRGDILYDICSYHSEIAMQLFPDIQFPEDKLTYDGWVKIGSVVYETPVIYGMPSQKQMDYLFDLGYIRMECSYNDKNVNFFYKH